MFKQCFTSNSKIDTFFRQTRSSSYDISSEVRERLEHAAELYEIGTISDWYKLKDVGSVFIEELQKYYSETEWQPWRFGRLPLGFWKDRTNQRNFFEWISRECNVEHVEDWYKITKRYIHQCGGTTLLDYFGGSPSAALKAVYPEEKWQLWRFHHLPFKFFDQISNQERYLEWIADQWKIVCVDDWYNVTEDAVHSMQGGSALLHHYGSLFKALSSIYPHAGWLVWLANEEVHSFWNDSHNCRQFLEWIRLKKLCFSDHRCWYSVTKEQILGWGGKTLLQMHGNSVATLLEASYPEHIWEFWRFQDLENRYWGDSYHVLRYLEWLCEVLSIHCTEDWYSVQKYDIQANHGAGLLHQYKGSLSVLFEQLFPEVSWHPWLFGETPAEFWCSNNVVTYLKWVEPRLNIKRPSDWFSVTKAEIIKHCGHSLINSSRLLILDTLKKMYPKEMWQPWTLELVPHSYWQGNQRRYFDWIAEILNLEKVHDWYEVKQHEVLNLQGRELLVHHYSGSLATALKSVYPFTEWLIWKFGLTSKVWDADTTSRYMQWLEDELGIQVPEEWYEISNEQIAELGGATLLKRTGGLMKLLQVHYPLHLWTISKWNPVASDSKAQLQLFKGVRSLLSIHTEILYNHTLQFVHFGKSKKCVEVDLWLPELNLALEYQGVQHFQPGGMMGGQFGKQATRDKEKRVLCDQLGITLVQVPTQWTHEYLLRMFHTTLGESFIFV